ncbi:hypothetical protein AYI70_g11792 [Smittium culicis]|uniref:Uncharacterized protein n=1 Tax=Smittium culicis TaxID=133412 RepID=A0A1R1X0B8_9FUNG|nr:hypothetical protein AYI70_g11792 [Smittium culicis]
MIDAVSATICTSDKNKIYRWVQQGANKLALCRNTPNGNKSNNKKYQENKQPIRSMCKREGASKDTFHHTAVDVCILLTR